MFQYFSNAKKERFTKQVPLKPRKRLYGWISAAAAVVICAGLFFNQPKGSELESEFTQEEIAAAQEALTLLGVNFNKGTQQISYLGEFEKNTNKFLIKQ